MLRHGKSSWDDDTLDDHDRPLNARGKRACETIARYIAQHKLGFDLCLSSTALRARETALRVSETLRWPAEIRLYRELYLAPPSEYLQAIRGVPDSSKRILIVGHNPGISTFASLLAGNSVELVTAALAVIAPSRDSWSTLELDSSHKLEHLVRPKELD